MRYPEGAIPLDPNELEGLNFPFPNGNGRHARIMTDAVLTKIFKKETLHWGGDEFKK